MEDLLVIRDYNSQDLKTIEIARKIGFDRKTVKKYLYQKTVPELP
jgi:transposase